MNRYINISRENIDKEHLCCAIADKKHQDGVCEKKEWLLSRIEEGHVFRKLECQGKVFIEYAPLEKAWVPVEGQGFEYIYCLWVAGSFKGKGYGKELLEYAINDARQKGKKGICTISSKKKKPFVSEGNFFKKYGFKQVDSIGEYELLALCFEKEKPQFAAKAKKMKIEDNNLTIYYSPQCPFTSNSVKEIDEFGKERKIKINLIKIDSLEKAKKVPCVFNNWATFINGEFVSNTLMNKTSVEKVLEKTNKI